MLRGTLPLVLVVLLPLVALAVYNRDGRQSDVAPADPQPDAAAPLLAEWGVTFAQYVAGVREAARLGLTDAPGKQAQRMRVAFLRAKGVLDKYDPDSGRRRYDLIIADPSPDEQWKRRQETLDSVLGKPTSRGTPKDEPAVPRDISFAAFCAKHPEWAEPNRSFVFFRDHAAFRSSATQRVLVQRQQLFGTCAIHAPVVLQHYLVAMANPGAPVATVDIGKWLRRKATAKILEGVLFGEGTSSYDVLSAILVMDSEILPFRRARENFGDIEGTLTTYGPLLVPMWNVTSDFLVAVAQHLGPMPVRTADGRPTEHFGFHSMLVVGSRRTPSGELRLLLQNWWRSKQFVDVDETYYRAAVGAAPAWYVTTPQPHIPVELDTTDAAFSVSAVDGSGVSFWGPVYETMR